VLLLLFSLFAATSCMAGFYARHLTEPVGWGDFELRLLWVDVELQGLFYRATIEFSLELTPYIGYNYYRAPRPGYYEVEWDFDLEADAVIVDCQMQPVDSAAGHYIRAEVVDITSAEEAYRAHPGTRPRLLLRERRYRDWRGTEYRGFNMRFSPVRYSPTETPVIKMVYLAPCLPRLAARRVQLPLSLFNMYKMTQARVRLYDPDNPDAHPWGVTGLENISGWREDNQWWATWVKPPFASPAIVAVAPENKARSYLRTAAADGASFYQLALVPPLPPERRTAKSILLAIDATEEGYNVLAFSALLGTFMQAVRLSLSPYDSVALFYSQFTPVARDSCFRPVTPAVLDDIYQTVQLAPLPMLNTLPHMLRSAVSFFNRHNRGGEIWLVTNARTHASPQATAMEIINQSYGIARHPIAFKIISNDGRWSYYSGYVGNDYLYENLARLSRGSFVRLRTAPAYDALDLMLDCIAPMAATVELDPEPQSGLTYSRFPLNRGRSNFPITLPYYEIGLFDGEPPFNVHFYASVDRALYRNDALVYPQHADPGWQSIVTYWYACYVLERLKQPQSYATIKYIEAISTGQRLLTPYSGFVIPGPDGLCAFERLAETTTAVPALPEQPCPAPRELTLSAYPNPFNPATTLSCDLSALGEDEKLTVRIFNCLGQEVRRFEIALQPDQRVTIHWDGRDEAGNQLTSGVYLAVAASGSLRKTLKLTIQR
jgi:hypothetical protein